MAVVVGIAGTRGSHSRKPPLYIFPDMNRQLKLRPMTAEQFLRQRRQFATARAGHCRRASKPIQTVNGPVYPYEDTPVNTGYVTGHDQFRRRPIRCR